ncbi:hypothetical protein ACGF3K_14445 [Streptomyces sp. NPDC047980]|uniref:hypothetical protein n=1 Tax=Streptomyces sp. NPDC047980 TaxID=3365494 RepID=UPI00371FD4F1
MTADLARLRAAQAKADEIIRTVCESPDGPLLLRVSVTDPATGQRLATGFANYTTDQPATPLRLVEATS